MIAGGGVLSIWTTHISFEWRMNKIFFSIPKLILLMFQKNMKNNLCLERKKTQKDTNWIWNEETKEIFCTGRILVTGLPDPAGILFLYTFSNYLQNRLQSLYEKIENKCIFRIFDVLVHEYSKISFYIFLLHYLNSHFKFVPS